ncbi:pentapeptide repeat-containing protein [Nocardia huaxiensis]|uniref:WD40 domain-containing protein n=1 Tax=Nocardia huaxiensis TaxID=2755382 RepID=UPI001E419A67|nr:pentapeptide repeat-containing protein [Nocardia huaxiensis]UFS94814.1 pentapeptide repeat-containing protein [Nocardia huaxiensis]
MVRGDQLHFHISYAPADEGWAAWLAWELEESAAGYRTRLQAWDLPVGQHFGDFVLHGVRECRAVIVVLSARYLSAPGSAVEWQTIIEHDPAKLVVVRVDESALSGLPDAVEVLDLAQVRSAGEAREAVLALAARRLSDSVAESGTGFGAAPGPGFGPTFGSGQGLGFGGGPADQTGPQAHLRYPASAPPFPPGVAVDGPRTGLSILHVAGPRFGHGLLRADSPGEADALREHILSGVAARVGRGVPTPDLIVVSGDITDSGSPTEFASAAAFLIGLRVRLNVWPDRLLIVPGNHDVSKKACAAYFMRCEADEIPPQWPYAEKLDRYRRLFDELYRGLDQPRFDHDRLWSLFPIPELRVVVAGLNSTMAATHLPDTDYGLIGDGQALWFENQLRGYEEREWLRLGLIRHDPLTKPGDPTALHDGQALTAGLGDRLHLLIHGPGPVGWYTGRLGNGLPDLPAAGPGLAEIIHLTTAGLARHSCADSAEPAVLEQEWRRSAGALRAADTVRPDGAGGSRTPGDQVGVSPDRQLLEDVAQVCEVRYPEATIVRIAAARPPYVLIKQQRDQVLDQWRIGVRHGDVTEQLVDEFRAQKPEPGSELVYRDGSASRAVVARAGVNGIRIRSYTGFQGLLDLRDYLAGQLERLREDPRYPPDLYVPQRFRTVERGSQEIRDDLVAELLNLVSDPDHGRFVLLLGDFGRGKTFALHELARRIHESEPTLVPILIDLRSMDRMESVFSLVATHLANHGEDEINLRALRFMLEQGRVVLLFDGFDELLGRVSYDNASAFLEILLQAAIGRAKVVVAGRTQHFESRTQVFEMLGDRVGILEDRTVLSIEYFTEDQIRQFLVNRHGGDEQAADARMQLLTGIPDLLELAGNPRMLSFIAELDERRLRSAGAQQVTGPTTLYRAILTAWLTYEAERAPREPGSTAEAQLRELWWGVTSFALRVWAAGTPYLQLSDLTDLAGGVAEQISGTRFTVAQHAHAIGSRSLLVRTENNLFGFIHPSVTEWLVTNHVASQFAVGVDAPPPLSQAQLSPLGVQFLCDCADGQVLRAWVDRTLSAADPDDNSRINAGRVAARLRTAPGLDLRGEELAGEDLSYRNLARVDLSGANLTGARLTGATLDGANLTGATLVGTRLERTSLAGADLTDANLSDAHLTRATLSGAVLRGANLTGAQLDRAVLVGADLTGADLTDAQLIDADLERAVLIEARVRRVRLDQATLVDADLTRADLTGARLARTNLTGSRADGSRWTRAALLEVIGRPTGTDLFGAARVPGTPVLTEYAAASTGVRHGVDTQRGRLPRPLAYSPDGGTIAIGSDDGGVMIYGADTGRQLRMLQGHRDRAFAVAYTDRVLVTGSADGTVGIWDAATGELRRMLSGHTQWPWPLEVNGTGSLLATGDADGVLRLRRLPDGQLLREFPPPDGRARKISSISFHGRQRLAAAYQDGAVRLWDLYSARETGHFAGGADEVYRVAWNPAGTRLAVSGANGALGLWDSAGQRVLNLPGHGGRVYALAFHPTEPLLASGDTNGIVHLWNTETGEHVRMCDKHAPAAIHWVTFDPNGDLLATGDSAGLVLLRDGRTAEPRHPLVGHTGSVCPFAFRPDGTQLAVTDDEFTLRVWDPATGWCQHTLSGHGRHVREVSFNADGSLLASCSNDGSVRWWDPVTGRQVERLAGSDDRLVTFTSAQFNPVRADQLAALRSDGRLSLYGLADRRYERHITVTWGPVWAIAYDPTARFIATANDDDSVTVWTRETGGVHAECQPHRGRVRSIAFDADGSRMATGCDDSCVRLWDMGSGELLRVLTGHTGRVYGVAFHGGLLASVSLDATVRIWDVEQGTQLQELDLHQGMLWALAVESGTGMLATAGDDLVIRLWDIRSGRLLHTLPGHRQRVRSLAFDPAGKLLASGANDGTIMLWSLGEAGTAPALRGTLLGLRDGWAAVAADGRFKFEGPAAGEFWHVIGMCRFEIGELSPYLPDFRRIEPDVPL